MRQSIPSEEMKQIQGIMKILAQSYITSMNVLSVVNQYNHQVLR